MCDGVGSPICDQLSCGSQVSTDAKFEDMARLDNLTGECTTRQEISERFRIV